MNLTVTSLLLVKNAFKTSLEMLEERGFDTSSVDQGDESVEKLFENRKMLWKMLHKDDKDRECFLYMEDPTINFKSENFISVMKKIEAVKAEELLTDAILIFNNPKPTFLEKKITQINKRTEKIITLELDQPKLKIQSFNYLEQQFNKTKHELVPRHIRLEKEQREKVIEKYLGKDGDPNLFPGILDTDPIARWLWLVPGDIVMIIRKSETCGTYVCFRHCITKDQIS